MGRPARPAKNPARAEWAVKTILRSQRQIAAAEERQLQAIQVALTAGLTVWTLAKRIGVSPQTLENRCRAAQISPIRPRRQFSATKVLRDPKRANSVLFGD